MKVVLIYRKRHKGNYSIENLFKQISAEYPPEIEWRNQVVTFYSKGFFRRILIGLQVMWAQSEINHVTGDINFATLFLPKKTTVLTIHDIGYMKHPNPISRFLLLWFWIRLPIKKVATVTVVSESTKRELLRYADLPPERIRVIPVPFSKNLTPTPRNFNKAKPTILQIGTKHNKNLSRLIRALEGICCQLEIVGILSEKTVKELATCRIEYKASVHLSDEEIRAKYNNCDIVSFVSTYEGFGIPILEANAVGRVVITSNILSMPEVAGNAACLVDPYDVNDIRQGIIRLINDDDYRNQLIENGFVNKNRFSLEKIAEEYVNIYKSVYASRKHGN